MIGRKNLLFGCGYLGLRVASRWLARGDEVIAVTRRAERSGALQASGIRPIIADVTDRASLSGLPSVDTILFAVGYDRESGQSIEDVYVGGVRNVLATIGEAPRRLIYVSTTGVYGDAAGEWIDESTPAAPARAGGQASLAAEEAVRESPLGPNAVILRVAGLYGPGRVPFLDKLRAGEPIPAPREGWLNLVHIDDAAAVVVAAAVSPFDGVPGPHILNVVDEEPVERAKYYSEAARLSGAAPPRFVAPDPASPRAARAGASRRISNARLRAALGVPLTFPTYREGLRSILSGSSLPNAGGAE